MLVPMELINGAEMFVGMLGAIVTEATIWFIGSLIAKGLGAIALGRDCWRDCGDGATAECWERGPFTRREDDKLVDASVC